MGAKIRKYWVPLAVAGTMILGLVVVIASGLLGLGRESFPQPSPPPEPTMVTYTLGAGGDSAAEVMFSCPQKTGASTLEMCGTYIPAGEHTVTRRITVETGMWLKVMVTSDSIIQPRCWISDKTDHVVFDQDEARDVASCQTLTSEEGGHPPGAMPGG